ncbi:MAG TPA: hypothetical protein VJ044_04710, partial [Candidatus Hodarchaeales archaeon]|nr:hypothetical protein [Candidatus Hodarchaeales archaeon]
PDKKRDFELYVLGMNRVFKMWIEDLPYIFDIKMKGFKSFLATCQKGQALKVGTLSLYIAYDQYNKGCSFDRKGFDHCMVLEKYFRVGNFFEGLSCGDPCVFLADIEGRSSPPMIPCATILKRPLAMKN